MAWSVSGLSSTVEPPDAPMDATLPFSLKRFSLMSMASVTRFVFVFRAVSHQGGNVLITDVVSNSAKH